MGEVSTFGLDVAKSVFQVHGVDSSGTVVIRKRVSRLELVERYQQPQILALSACTLLLGFPKKAQKCSRVSSSPCSRHNPRKRLFIFRPPRGRSKVWGFRCGPAG